MDIKVPIINLYRHFNLFWGQADFGLKTALGNQSNSKVFSSANEIYRFR